MNSRTLLMTPTKGGSASRQPLEDHPMDASSRRACQVQFPTHFVPLHEANDSDSGVSGFPESMSNGTKSSTRQRSPEHSSTTAPRH